MGGDRDRRGAEVVLGALALEVIGARLHRVAPLLDVHDHRIDDPVVESAQVLLGVEEDRQRHDRRDQPVEERAPQRTHESDGPRLTGPGDPQTEDQLAEGEPLRSGQPDHQQVIGDGQRHAHADQDLREQSDRLGGQHQHEPDDQRHRHHGGDHRVHEDGQESFERGAGDAAVQWALHRLSRGLCTGRRGRGARAAGHARCGSRSWLVHRRLGDHHLIVLFLGAQRCRAGAPRFEGLAGDQLDALILRVLLGSAAEVPRPLLGGLRPGARSVGGTSFVR